MNTNNKILKNIPNFLIIIIVHLLKKIGGKLLHTGKQLFLYKFQPRTLEWHKLNGDKTLRIDYNLNNESVVFDVGGYLGHWSYDISARYGSQIHIFEPVNKFANIIRELYKNNQKITVNEIGLSNTNIHTSISDEANSSSAFKTSAAEQKIVMKKASEYLREHNIQKIDLIKINIEGGEYDLLEHLITEGFIQHITNIQVQFHDFVPHAKERMTAIREQLKKTHVTTYQYEFVWENWQLKNLPLEQNTRI